MILQKTYNKDWPWLVYIDDQDRRILWHSVRESCDLWCFEKLGEIAQNWDRHSYGWKFKKRDDATLFVLTWDGSQNFHE